MQFCSLSKHLKTSQCLRLAMHNCLLVALLTLGFNSLTYGQAKQIQGSPSTGIPVHENQAPANSAVTRRPLTAEEVKAVEAYQRKIAQQEALKNPAAGATPGASATAQIRSPQLPPGFPLPADEQMYVEQVLDYWQQTSDKVKHYQCDFLRYEYDTTNVNIRDPRTNQLYAFQQAAGEVRFASPDKARFETTKVFRFEKPPEKAGGEAIYKPLPGHTLWGRNIHECWVCTGESTFDFDFGDEQGGEQKARYETKIPPELQGNIAESPLPFLFGAKKNDVMNRYWVRYIPKYETDAQGKKKLIQNEIWLDIYPKRVNDAQVYSKVELILSAEDFMPLAIHMYAPNYNPAKNNYSSRYFLFQNRKINGTLPALTGWMNKFVEPSVPVTWRKVVRQSAPAKSAQRPAEKR